MGAETGQLTVSSMDGCNRVPICRSRVATTTLMVLFSSFFCNHTAATETDTRATAAATAIIKTGRLFIIFFLFLNVYRCAQRVTTKCAAVPNPMAKA